MLENLMFSILMTLFSALNTLILTTDNTDGQESLPSYSGL